LDLILQNPSIDADAHRDPAQAAEQGTQPRQHRQPREQLQLLRLLQEELAVRAVCARPIVWGGAGEHGSPAPPRTPPRIAPCSRSRTVKWRLGGSCRSSWSSSTANYRTPSRWEGIAAAPLARVFREHPVTLPFLQRLLDCEPGAPTRSSSVSNAWKHPQSYRNLYGVVVWVRATQKGPSVSCR